MLIYFVGIFIFSFKGYKEINDTLNKIIKDSKDKKRPNLIMIKDRKNNKSQKNKKSKLINSESQTSKQLKKDNIILNLNKSKENKKDEIEMKLNYSYSELNLADYSEAKKK